MDVLTPEQRHKNMSHIKNKDSKIELILRKALWNRGIRYRKNFKDLPGKPDIVLTKHKIAVFCDSEYFHGKDWDSLLPRLQRGNNPEFWIQKISGNIEHDRMVNRKLTDMGWRVVRFWGNDIKKHPDECVEEIISLINNLQGVKEK